MKCCVNCFNDIELKAFIEGRKLEGNCDICNSKAVKVYDMNSDDELATMFDEFLNIYTHEKNLPTAYPSELLKSLKYELTTEWNIFNLEPTDVSRLMNNLFEETYPEKLSLFRGEVGILDLLDAEKVRQNSILKGHKWEEFVEHIKYVNRFHANFINFEILDDFLKRIISDISNGQVLYRARRSNDKVLDKKDLKAPPKGNATAGRANSEGISHLYLATEAETAIREIRPSEGDTVYIGEFEVEDNLTILDLKNLDNISAFQINNKLQYILSIKEIKKISNEISKPVKRTDSKLDYLPTQYIVDYIKSKTDEEDFENCVGIGFKSTVCNSGSNIMIFNPEIIECKNVKVKEIKSIVYNY